MSVESPDRRIVEKAPARIVMDLPTVIATSAVAWILVDVLHEIVGHAGAAALLGIPVRAVSTTTLFLEWDQIQSMDQNRAIHASATALNLATGVLALAALRWRWGRSPASRHFWWAFATMSFVVVTLNLTVGAAGGDWAVVIDGLEPAGLWRAGVMAAGIVLTVLGYALPLRLWLPDLRRHRRLQLMLTATPVLVLLVVQTLSVLGSPFAAVPMDSGANALLSSAALYVFFGMWLALVNFLPVPRSSAPVDSIRVTRSTGWLIIGLVATVVFVAVLGPGLGPLEADPRLT